MGSLKHHNVYIVLLDEAILKKRRFMQANPDYDYLKPCLYVGMTGLNPRKRFGNHKAGYKANRYVRDYGVRLIPRLYREFNPMTYKAAQAKEISLAEELRAQGYAVWQH